MLLLHPEGRSHGDLTSAIAGVLLFGSLWLWVGLFLHGLINGIVRGKLLINVQTRAYAEGAPARIWGAVYTLFGAVLSIGCAGGLWLLLQASRHTP